MASISSVRSPITPGLIVAGIGAADRQTLAQFLSFFESESVLSILGDQLEELVRSAGAVIHVVQPTQVSTAAASAAERLSRKTGELHASGASDDTLRLMLWMHLRKSFLLPPEVTFSRRGLEAQRASLIGSVALKSVRTHPDRG